MIKIHGTGATRWVKCIWMARELGIPFEEVNVKYNPAGGFGDQDYRQLHPFGAVPALEDGSLKLFESQAIVNYLGEKYPEHHLIPKSGTAERALYDQWTFYCTSTLENPLWNWFRHSYIFDQTQRNEKEIERCANELKKHLAILNTLLSGKEFLVGDQFTAADITMSYTLNWAKAYGFLQSYENLGAYLKKHLSREAFPKHLLEKK